MEDIQEVDFIKERRTNICYYLHYLWIRVKILTLLYTLDLSCKFIVYNKQQLAM